MESLYAAANEPSLEDRRIKLSLQYAAKLKAYPSNPAHNCVFKPLYTTNYEKQPNTIQPFGLRIKPHLEASNVHLDEIACIKTPKKPPWLNPKPVFNFELCSIKSLTVILCLSSRIL